MTTSAVASANGIAREMSVGALFQFMQRHLQVRGSLTDHDVLTEFSRELEGVLRIPANNVTTLIAESCRARSPEQVRFSQERLEFVLLARGLVGEAVADALRDQDSFERFVAQLSSGGKAVNTVEFRAIGAMKALEGETPLLDADVRDRVVGVYRSIINAGLREAQVSMPDSVTATLKSMAGTEAQTVLA
jgi:hypothetical protein